MKGHRLGCQLYCMLAPRPRLWQRSYSTTGSATQGKSPDPLEYARCLVHQNDYENYLASLFIPSHARPAVWAIRAFNVETAQIRDTVKNADLGRLRIKWWRDAIDNTFAGKPPNHPVMLLLAQCLESSNLSHSWFKRILKERENNLSDPQYPSLKALEQYAENTASSILYLELEALGLHDHNADHAASHVGKALGITTVLRGTPFHVAERRFHLPSDIMAKHSLSTEAVFRTGPSHELEEVVFEVATAANDQLITARSHLKDCPPTAFPVLLSAVPCNMYLETLEKANFNIFDKSLVKRSWRLPLSLWNAARKRTF
ncbi:Squalene/phytoene synthase [Gaertneriomyces semiglobifer]|nr:Squalene/phytoene synthase [Gaertneriomyces semiglobifer]